MLLLSSQDFTGHQEFFLYVRGFLHSCIYLSLSIRLSIYRSIPQVCFSLLSSQATCRSRICHRINKEKGTVTSQKPNLCLCGTWEFSPKNLRTEKMPRQIIFISIKAFERYVAHFLKRCP